MEEEFLLTSPQIVHFLVSLLQVSLHELLGVAFFLNLVVEFFNGVAASQEQHVSLLLLGIAFVEPVATSALALPACAQLASCKGSIGSLVVTATTQLVDREFGVGAAPFRIVGLGQPPSQLAFLASGCDQASSLESCHRTSSPIVAAHQKVAAWVLISQLVFNTSLARQLIQSPEGSCRLGQI